MSTAVATTERDVVRVEDAHLRPMMGLDILEPLPSRSIPYEQVDPFLLVHEYLRLRRAAYADQGLMQSAARSIPYTG